MSDPFNAQAVLDAAARTLQPVVAGVKAWWQGDADTSVNNGVADLPSPAKVVSELRAAVPQTAADAATASAAVAAITEALAIRLIYPTTDAGVATALTGYNIGAAGAGGANGSFALALPPPSTGGDQAIGSFTVAGGRVTAIAFSDTGSNYQGPIALSNAAFAASAGLAGAAATLQAGGGVLFGQVFGVSSPTTSGSVDLYTNVSGVATSTDQSVPSTALVSSAIATVAQEVINRKGVLAVGDVPPGTVGGDTDGYGNWSRTISLDGTQNFAALVAQISTLVLLNIGGMQQSELSLPGFVQAMSDVYGGVGWGTKLDGSLQAASIDVTDLQVVSINGSPAAALPKSVPVFPVEVAQIMANGQSNSTGTIAGLPGGLPTVLSTSQPYDTLSYNGGVRARDGKDGSNTPATNRSSLVPLIETFTTADTGEGETVLAGMTQMIKQLLLEENGLTFDETTFQLVASTAGHGGRSMQQLQKTGGDGSYDQVTYDLQYLPALVPNKTMALLAVPLSQGEEDDFLNTPIATWISGIQQLIDDTCADATSLNGQSIQPIFILDQLSSHLIEGQPTPHIALAQLQICTGQSGSLTPTGRISNCYLACPTYFLDYISGGTTPPLDVHFYPIGHKERGAYMGIVFKRVIFDQMTDWMPLMCTGYTRSGPNLLLTFNRSGLVLDTTTITPIANAGLRLRDSSGNAIAITRAPTVVNKNQISLGAARNLLATDVLDYGFVSDVSTTASPSSGRTTGPRGQIRDSQGDTLVFDREGLAIRMDNYLPMFQLTLT